MIGRGVLHTGRYRRVEFVDVRDGVIRRHHDHDAILIFRDDRKRRGGQRRSGIAPGWFEY
jgi:hypothetical protein